MKFKYVIEDVITDLEDIDEVFVEISDEDTMQLFEDAGVTPCNEEGDPDEDYVYGELQFHFAKNTDDITEILLFPVYEDEGEVYNGDFINITNTIMDNKDLIADVIKAKNGVL